jgi:hypothetical protein
MLWMLERIVEMNCSNYSFFSTVERENEGVKSLPPLVSMVRVEVYGWSLQLSLS